jgi:tetratricopeptide (TPR) repeat protein
VAAFALGAIVAHYGNSARNQRALERAESYFKEGEYDKAKIEYLNLLRLDRKNPSAVRQLGFIWFEEGAPLRAYPYLLKARELIPADLAIRTKLAQVLVFLGEADAAREEANAILEESPGEEEALLVLTETVRSPEEAEETKARLRKIPEEDNVAYHMAWANLALHEGNLAYAQTEVKEALELQPRSARIHLAMAGLFSQQGKVEQAEEEFKAAAQQSPARSAARLQYAQFEKQIGKIDEATVLLKEITQQVPDYLPAWSLLAEIALSQGKPGESLSLLENVLARDPQNLEALILQAEGHLAQRETKKAVEELESLSANYPHVPLINYHLARAYFEDGNLPAATAAANEAVAAKQDYADAILLLGELNLANGNATLVVPAMLGLLKRQPGLTPAWRLLQQAYRASGRPQDAVASILREIEACPQSADAYLRLGRVLREQQQPVEARQVFEHARQLVPESLEPLEELVDLDLSQKHFDEAMKRVQDLLAEEPDSADGYALAGKVYHAQGHWKDAEAALRKALELDPSLSDAFDLLISTYISTNQPDRAIAELQALLAKDPRNTDALTNLARIYFEHQKDYPKATDAYEKLLAVSPNSVEAMNDLAYIYAEYLNQIDKAYELARKARNLKPNDPAIADTLGWTLYKNADYREALTLLRESVEKLPDSPDVQFHFGMASYMMADTNAAQKAFAKALQTEQEFAGKSEAQRRLAFLESADRREISTAGLEAALGKQADDVVVCMRLGEAYASAGFFAKAAAAYDQALQVNAELLPAVVRLAELNAGPLQNNNMAFALAKRARDLDPNDAHVAGLLGHTAYQLNNFPWAYSLLQESARRLDRDPNVLHDYAWAAYSIGRISEAQQLMRRVIEVQPASAPAQDAKSFLTMTELDRDREHLEAAERQIQNILAANNHYVPALMAKADLEIGRGQSKSAEATLSDVLGRYPDFAPAQRRLAAVYLQDPARIGEAYELALKATNALPDDPELAQTLGEISYKRNDFTHAIQWFQESARRQPLRGTDLYYLGMSQLRMSKDAESSKSLQDALAAGLPGPMSAEAKAVLSELRRRQGLL